jgi:mRNA-degrading endonuclease RelE of RelBE toxin-antitoxin system
VTYAVIFEKNAQKEFEALSDGERKAIFKELKKLENTYEPKGYKELKGYSPLKRVKSSGVRAVYDEPNGRNRIFILRIGTNHSVYDDLRELLK